jgi:integrase/recombinase XerD
MHQHKREPLTQTEVIRLRQAARDPREMLIVELLFEVGLRVSELARFDPELVDWQSRRVTVYGKGGPYGANSKRRVLPLSDNALLALERYQGLLMRRKGKKNTWLSSRTIERIVKDLANRAKIRKPTTPHVLRHTYGVTVLRRGIGVRTLQELLGHERLSTTMIYTKLSPEDVCAEFQAKW